jgi:alkanesulfonate monooxygenase SsuD/methylene tetrahydromethanopterin reductase-like flavin-dependent oxidoreductase (luciferase family)
MSARDIEFGLDSAAYVSVDQSGRNVSGDVVIRNTVEEAVVADSVGIDSFNIAEHYRPDFMDSAGHVILAAIAARTERIRLGTAVTVLSTEDPVRVYAEFATLDAVSNGRVQLIAGRGSLTESFPLFGFDLADYEVLFEEKLDLLMRLIRAQPVTWSGSVRSPLIGQYVNPPRPGWPPAHLGRRRRQPRVGGPGRPVRAPPDPCDHPRRPEQGHPARRLLPARSQLKDYGHPPLPVGMHSIGFVARTDEEAVAVQWPYWAEMFSAAAEERGREPPAMEKFRAEIAAGSVYVGSPQTVAAKLAAAIRLLGLSRFDLA